MAIICPTITELAGHNDKYDACVKLLAGFAPRIHIDLADGVFAPTKLTDIEYLWWPDEVSVDLHVMYETAFPYIDKFIELNPQRVIIHAESAGSYFDFASRLEEHGIGVGVALLPDTPIEKIAPAIHKIEHVLVFAGKLGYHGGHAQMDQLFKVRQLRGLKPSLEIGWDGGVTLENARKLVVGGVDVLNVGSAIHNAKDPKSAYAILETAAKGGK